VLPASTCAHHAPFYNSLSQFLINSIYTHMSCRGLFQVRHKEFGNLIRDSTIGINSLSVADASSLVHCWAGPNVLLWPWNGGLSDNVAAPERIFWGTSTTPLSLTLFHLLPGADLDRGYRISLGPRMKQQNTHPHFSCRKSKTNGIIVINTNKSTSVDGVIWNSRNTFANSCSR
jgi:hypothetical protein